MPPEWTTLLRLAGVLAGQGPDADVDALDDFVALAVVARPTASPDRDPGGVLAAVEPNAAGPERILDLMLRDLRRRSATA